MHRKRNIHAVVVAVFQVYGVPSEALKNGSFLGGFLHRGSEDA